MTSIKNGASTMSYKAFVRYISRTPETAQRAAQRTVQKAMQEALPKLKELRTAHWADDFHHNLDVVDALPNSVISHSLDAIYRGNVYYGTPSTTPDSKRKEISNLISGGNPVAKKCREIVNRVISTVHGQR